MRFACVQPDGFDDVGEGSAFLADLEANDALDPPATLENFQRRIPSRDEPVLQSPPVLQASGLAP
jgi:hypothetical protein